METENCKGRAAGMTRLIIVCEGPTEHEFCMDVLAGELSKSDIHSLTLYFCL